MFSNAQQYAAANKAFLESQIATVSNLASIALQGTEKIIALNLALAKSAPEANSAAAKELLAAKDPQALVAQATTQAKLNAEKVTAYSRNLTEIVSTTKADLAKLADAQLAEAQSRVSTFLDGVAQSAPTGSENLMAMLKSSVANSYAGYEQVNNAAKQAVEAAEAQVAKASDQLAQVVKNVAA
jgi:phasin family protein